MKGKTTVRKNMQILREVFVHNHVHILRRPGKVIEKNFSKKNKVEHENCQPILKTMSVNFDTASISTKSPYVDRYEEGFLAGKIEGNSLAVSEVKKELQLEFDDKREQLFQEAYKVGQQQGFSIGKKEGLIAAQNEAAELNKNLHQHVMQFEKILSTLPNQLDSYLRNAEDELVVLCFTAITQILGETLISESAIHQLIDSLVKRHLKNVEFAVHLHPDDYVMFTSANAARVTGAYQIRWVSDADIKMGGLIIRSSEQSLDARLDFQIELLKQSLLKARIVRNNESHQMLGQALRTEVNAGDENAVLETA